MGIDEFVRICGRGRVDAVEMVYQGQVRFLEKFAEGCVWSWGLGRWEYGICIPYMYVMSSKSGWA